MAKRRSNLCPDRNHPGYHALVNALGDEHAAHLAFFRHDKKGFPDAQTAQTLLGIQPSAATAVAAGTAVPLGYRPLQGAFESGWEYGKNRQEGRYVASAEHEFRAGLERGKLAKPNPFKSRTEPADVWSLGNWAAEQGLPKSQIGHKAGHVFTLGGKDYIVEGASVVEATPDVMKLAETADAARLKRAETVEAKKFLASAVRAKQADIKREDTPEKRRELADLKKQLRTLADARVIAARRGLSDLRAKQRFSGAEQERAAELVGQFVPKSEQYRFIDKILKATDSDGVNELLNDIDDFVVRQMKKQAVSSLEKFIRKVNKKYRMGRRSLGGLPDDVRAKFMEFLDRYDFRKLSKGKRKKLAGLRQYLGSFASELADAASTASWREGLDPVVENVLGLDDRIDNLKRLGAKPVSDMSFDEIASIHGFLKHLIAMNDLKRNSKIRRRIEMLQERIRSAVHDEILKVPTGTVVKERKSLWDYLARLGQARLDTMVGFVTGRKNDAMMKTFMLDPERGLERQKAAREGMIAFGEKKLSQIGFSMQDVQGMSDRVMVMIGGSQVETDISTLMTIYGLVRADGKFNDLVNARGINIMDADGRMVRTGPITVAEVRQAMTKLPQRFKDIMEVFFEVNRYGGSTYINPVSRQHEGYDKAYHDVYWHLQREHDVPFGGSTVPVSRPPNKRGRFMPETGGTDRVVLGKAHEEFMRNIDDTSAYYGMTVPLENMRTMLFNQDFRVTMRDNGHGRALDQMDTMLSRIQDHPTNRSILESGLAKFMRRAGQSVLGLRVSGGLVQLTSPLASAGVIDARYLLIPRRPPSEADIQLMYYTCPLLLDRWKSHTFDFVLGDVAVDHEFSEAFLGHVPLLSRATEHYTIADRAAIWTVFCGAQDQIEASGLARGTLEFTKAVHSLMNQALRGQGQYDMLHRCPLTSDPNVFLKASSMFMSSMNAFYNTCTQAMDDRRKGRIDAAKMATAIGGVVASLTTAVFVRHLFNLGMKAAALGLLFSLGYKRDKKYGDAMEDVVKRDLANVPADILGEAVGLSVYGTIVSTISDHAIQLVRDGYSPNELDKIRTGNLFADVTLDLSEAVAQGTVAVQQMYTGDRFESGPRKGQLKWPASAEKSGAIFAELTALATGVPFSGLKSNFYYPVTSDMRTLERQKTPDELRRLIQSNTNQYGRPHPGQEEKVAQWRRQLAGM